MRPIQFLAGLLIGAGYASAWWGLALTGHAGLQVLVFFGTVGMLAVVVTIFAACWGAEPR